MKTTTIKDYYGKIIGYVETNPNGNKTVRNFYKQIVGYYDAKRDVTLNFYKQIVAKGDVVVGLLDIKK